MGAGLEPGVATSRFKWDLGIGWYDEVRESGPIACDAAHTGVSRRLTSVGEANDSLDFPYECGGPVAMHKSTTVLRVLGLTAAVAIAVACGGGSSNPTGPTPTPTPSYTIIGTWNYTEIAGTTARDRGTITFTGSPSVGSYTLRNFYDIEYFGTFTVTNSIIRLQGTKLWTGAFGDANNIAGTWQTAENGTVVTGPLALVRQ